MGVILLPVIMILFQINIDFSQGVAICGVLFAGFFFLTNRDTTYVIVNQQNECIRENNALFKVPEGHEERGFFSREFTNLSWLTGIINKEGFDKKIEQFKKNQEKIPNKIKLFQNDISCKPLVGLRYYFATLDYKQWSDDISARAACIYLVIACIYY